MVVLDDETVSRMGLVAILAEDSAILIDAADTMAQATAAVRRDPPDVVLISADYSGEGDGIDALGEFVSYAGVPVLFVARDPSSAIVREARRTGAAGLISKRTSSAAIRGAVHAAAAGAAVFPRLSQDSSAKEPSGRERQVIDGVADGRTNDEIAGALGLSTRTIASHLRRCFHRYGVSSRTELAMLAVRERWCSDVTLGLLSTSAEN